MRDRLVVVESKLKSEGILACGYHYPMIAIAGLIVSLPPIGIPTICDAWIAAINVYRWFSCGIWSAHDGIAGYRVQSNVGDVSSGSRGLGRYFVCFFIVSVDIANLCREARMTNLFGRWIKRSSLRLRDLAWCSPIKS